MTPWSRPDLRSRWSNAAPLLSLCNLRAPSRPLDPSQRASRARLSAGDASETPPPCPAALSRPAELRRGPEKPDGIRGDPSPPRSPLMPIDQDPLVARFQAMLEPRQQRCPRHQGLLVSAEAGAKVIASCWFQRIKSYDFIETLLPWQQGTQNSMSLCRLTFKRPSWPRSMGRMVSWRIDLPGTKRPAWPWYQGLLPACFLVPLAYCPLGFQRPSRPWHVVADDDTVPSSSAPLGTYTSLVLRLAWSHGRSGHLVTWSSGKLGPLVSRRLDLLNT